MPRDDEPVPIDHEITVNFNHVLHDETYPPRFVDSIDYLPAVLRVQRGDRVRWTSNFNLKVCFHRGTPFEWVQLEVPAGTWSEYQRVLDSVSKKGYHYNVHGALAVDDLLFFGDPGCPELIVE